MLFFLHADNSSKVREFGVFSDERYHLVGGNDAVTAGTRARLPCRCTPARRCRA